MAEQNKYTIVGTPFSTFTRTITSAFHYKGIPFEQKRTEPHSELAAQHHPFGFLPSLVIENPRGETVTLRESIAIKRYLDRVHPEPSLNIVKHSQLPEKLDELVSLAATQLYPGIEFSVVKPRVALVDEGKLQEDEIHERLTEGIVKLRSVLSTFETLLDSDGPFALGKAVTWADLFMYPPVADLLALPEGNEIPERLQAWAKNMLEVKGIQETYTGTLAAGGRP